MKLSTAQIRRILPHRYPMLLVDRVLELDPGQRITSVKSVTGTEPCYRHLDEDADDESFAYPETLIVESWAQSAGIVASTGAGPADDRVMLLGGATGVVFTGRVYPGDVLVHRARITKHLGDTVIFSGETTVGVRTVMTIGQMTMAFRPASALRPVATA
jgi:3-hydroxyacyl-[acyl-carrier-protein] dehydratase